MAQMRAAIKTSDCADSGDGRSAAMLPIWRKGLYGAGQFAEGINNLSFELFALFYYTQVAGLSASLAGLAMLLVFCVDAAIDPWIGAASDRCRSRLGRRHPFMYAAAIPVCAGFAMFFNAPDGVDQATLFAWMVVSAVMLRVGMSLYHVPHMAQGAELSGHTAERVALVAWRNGFGALGRIAAISLAFGYFFAAGDATAPGQLDKNAYPSFAICFGLLMATAILISSLGTQKLAVTGQPVGEDIAAMPAISSTWQLVNNPSYRALIVGSTFFYVALGLTASLSLHLKTYLWQLTASNVLIIGAVGAFGLICGIMVARITVVRFERAQVFSFGICAYVLAGSIPVFSWLLGVAPPAGSWQTTMLLCGSTLLASIFIGQVGVSAGAMVAEISDEERLRSRQRHEGALFGGLALTSQAAAGIGGLLAGIAIDIAAFPTGAAATVGSVSTAKLATLVSVSVAVTTALCLAAAWAGGRYRLSREKHAEILGELRRMP